MDDFRPLIGAYWGSRELTFGGFKARVREFLEGLRGLHPVFGEWFVLGDRMSDEKPLGVDLEHLDVLMLERGWNTTVPKNRFTHLDAEGRPTTDSTVSVGWDFDVVTEPEAQRTKDFVYASISLGATHPKIPNSVLLQVFDPASPLLDRVVTEQVFRYMIEFCNPTRGLVTDPSYRSAVGGSEKMGWLNYRADSSFSKFLPDTVQHEPFNDGVLFRIGDGRVLNENNLTEVQLGKQIQQNILAHQ
jgi:hypothetical protein